LTIIKLFIALGNNRPPILVQLEDYVLQGIVGVMEGRSHEDVLDTIFSQIESIEDHLTGNEDALNWFSLYSMDPVSASPRPPPSGIPSTPVAGM
jgi:hypothetical protein